MGSRLTLRRLFLTAAISLVCALYLADLTGMGLVTPDEPRYAAVGKAMAQSGDWITPRLWGDSWFEKPALLYWMTATAFRLGLGDDLAPRLPVALLSLSFLAFFWWRLRLEWDARVASFSTLMLATSGGWLAYSHIGVTDLPLSVFFAAAVLLSMPWIIRGERDTLTAAGACLGLAALAKGLVPLVLFVPVLALGWRRLGDWFRPGPLLGFCLCALPWYVLCWARPDGNDFLRVFFVEQQFGRFSSQALQHVQPWWFYIPSLLLLLFPWFPLLALAGRDWKEPKVRFLSLVGLFGFVFFSASVNKLPGYVLPLVPLVCVLMGLGLAQARQPGLFLIVPLALTALLPVASQILPVALSTGLRAAAIPWSAAGLSLAGGAVIGFLVVKWKETKAVSFIATIVGLSFFWFELTTFPKLDAAASARPLWIRSHPACTSGVRRSLLYGLQYYAGRKLPECAVLDPGGKQVVR